MKVQSQLWPSAEGTHVKISHLVTTCYQAVIKMCLHCLFPVVDKSGTTCYQAVNKMCSRCLFPVVDKSGTTCYQAVINMWGTSSANTSC